MNDTEILLKDSDIFYEFFSKFDSNKENDYNINEKEIKNLLKVKISKKRNREKNNDNDIEYIKKEKLKKNAESARRTRQRKKLAMENLINENRKLKNIICQLKSERLLICKQCKKKLNIENYKTIFNVSQKNSNINTNKKRFLFTIISVIVFCIFLSFNKINISNIEKQILKRNLSLFDKKINTFQMSNNEIKDINLTYNKWYITLGDYYSIITKNKKFFVDYEKISYSIKNEGIRYLKENDIFNKNLTNCLNCMVELNRNKIEHNLKRINRFRLYFYPKEVITSYGFQHFQNNKDEKGNIFQTFFEIDCIAFGFSENRLYTNNESISNYKTIF